MIWLWICAIVWAHPQVYSGQLTNGQSVVFHIQYQGTTLFSLHAKDGQSQQRYDWLQDNDPRQGYVQLTLPQFILPSAEYTLVVAWPTQTEEHVLQTSAPTTEVTIDTITPSTAVIGWNKQAIAWASTQKDGTLSIIGSNEHSWEYWALGSNTPYSSMSNHHELVLQLREMVISPQPNQEQPIPLWVWIIPFLFISATLYGVRHATKNWIWGLLAGLIVAGIATRGIWTDPFSLRLQANGPIYDPIDSMALMNHVWQGVSSGSMFGDSYGWPVGSSWWTGGPAWMVYALGGWISTWSNAIFAHNLLIVMQYILLGFCGWLLGTSLGIRRSFAVLAGISAGLSPMIIDECDAISLDRASLFVAPLYLLCLHTALSDKGNHRWVLAAGTTLGLSLHLQVYYGTFLALASPFFVLWRLLLLPARKKTFFHAIGIAIVALLIMLPALHALDNFTSSSYDVERSSFQFSQLERNQVNQQLRLPEATQSDNPTSTDRVVNAARFSLEESDFLYPREWLIGGSWYWFLIIAALLIGNKRRQTAVFTLDTGTLLAFSLGPLLIISGQWTGTILPYALWWDLPGVSQLRNTHRFALLAATISTIPILLGLESISQRLPDKITRLVWLPCLALFWPLPQHSMIEKYQLDEELSAVKNQSAMLLPYQRIAKPWQAKMGAIYGLKLVNPPTFEQGQTPLSLVETNGFANQLACLSGYTDICFAPGQLEYYKMQAAISGIDLVVVSKKHVVRQQDTNLFLQNLASLILDTEQYQVWRIDSKGKID